MRAGGRWAAGAVAGVALLALTAQAVVSARLIGAANPAQVLWAMAGYFTVLTNALVVVVLGRVALTGRVTARIAGGITVSILLVGLVYHAVLAGLWQPVGLAWWADQGLHSAVPLAVLAWWAGCAPRRGLGPTDVVAWFGWPVLYLAYALGRQLATGFVPYPFLDLERYGWAGVAANVGVLLAILLVLGACLLAVARLIGTGRG